MKRSITLLLLAFVLIVVVPVLVIYFVPAGSPLMKWLFSISFLLSLVLFATSSYYSAIEREQEYDQEFKLYREALEDLLKNMVALPEHGTGKWYEMKNKYAALDKKFVEACNITRHFGLVETFELLTRKD